jgi:Photosynthesis affected mutant 68
MSSESSGDRLPFEPRQKKKKPAKTAPTEPVTATSSTPSKRKSSETAKLSAIPDGVSKRMIRRMAAFCGIPTVCGIGSFVAAYWIVQSEWFKLPTVAVLLISMGFFGLGVVGLSYGILSTSWDEDRPGSWWGWEEFKINFKRMTTAWRAARREFKGE